MGISEWIAISASIGSVIASVAYFFLSKKSNIEDISRTKNIEGKK